MRRLVVLSVLLGGACIDLGTPERLPKKNPNFLVIGHHGAPNLAAENTRDSVEAAMQVGARGVEVDLNVTADGQIVCWHDRDPDDSISLARQQGLEGLAFIPWVPPTGSPYRKPVDQLSLADFLANYGYSRAGSGVRDPASPIMVLPDFLAWARQRANLRVVYLDVKAPAGRADQATLIYDTITAAVLADSKLGAITIYITSPQKDIVQAFIAARARAPAASIRPVWDFEAGGALAGTQELGLADVSSGDTPLRSESDFLDDVDAAVAARRDKQIDTVTVWTVDSPAQMATMLFHDVDAVITNDPQRLYELWQLTL